MGGRGRGLDWDMGCDGRCSSMCGDGGVLRSPLGRVVRGGSAGLCMWYVHSFL